MYDSTLTRQALPSTRLRMLIGTAIVVFNSNLSFLIENFLTLSSTEKENWWTLMDVEAGTVARKTKDFLISNNREDIAEQFKTLVNNRNRIVHSFQFSHNDSDHTQGMATLVKKTHEQFEIDEPFLLEFIKDNETLCLQLYELRGY